MYIKPITAEDESAVRQNSVAMKAIVTHCSTNLTGKLFCDNLGESC
jgi:hypothetical protein